MANPLSDSFWQIIETARASNENSNQSLEPEALQDQLEEMSDEQVAQFARDFYQGLINLNDWRLWGAGFVMAGGMGDDSFHYFRSWVIGRGQEAYETALNDPDNLGKFADDEAEFDNELLEYVPLEVLEARGVEEDPREEFDVTADDAPRGTPWDEESVYELYPKLSARFG